MSKIVEYAVHDQVYHHFFNHKIFHPNHHGFLGHHNTSTALIQLQDLWLEASENKELSAALLLDLSAAFDVVDHSIFLKKLNVYKFSEKSIEWFKSYLESRRFFVQVESKISKKENLEDIGVPQGSILGPLIFIIFCNDFPDSSEDGESVLYADDNTDNTHDKDQDILITKIQSEADRSTSWI